MGGGKKILPVGTLVYFMRGEKLEHKAKVVWRDGLSAYSDLALFGVKFFSKDEMKKAVKEIPQKSTIPPLDIIPTISDFFATEPVLNALREKMTVPLADELLHSKWNDANSVKSPGYTDDELKDLKEISDIIQPKSPTDGEITISLDDSNGTLVKTSLDFTQRNAAVQALTQRICCIQGPPGTGKTYIGDFIVRLLIGKTNAKVLVVCYTNHALDQLLEHLLDAGETGMVRIGGRCKSEKVARYNLREMSRKTASKSMEMNRAIGSSYGLRKKTVENISKHRKEILMCASMKNRSEETMLSNYLLKNNPHEYKQLFPPCNFKDDDFQEVRRKDYFGKTYYHWKMGSLAPQVKGIVKGELWNLYTPERRLKINTWISEYLDDYVEDICDEAISLQHVYEQLVDLNNNGEESAIEQARIIGCTTTGAAINRDLLKSAKITTVMIEEAAEILEAHVLCSLFEDTRHLIMIGDHKQLRPKVNTYQLRLGIDKFDLDRSLFERMVKSGFPITTLHQQHRMHPSISDMIRQITYPELVDGDKAKDRPSFVNGLQKHVLFIDHRKEEASKKELRDNDGDGGSKVNLHEAGLIAALVQYLLQQGYRAGQLVVLTPYLGQLMMIRKAMTSRGSEFKLGERDKKDLKKAKKSKNVDGGDGDGDDGDDSDSDENDDSKRPTPSKDSKENESVRLSTIDNYQGEEADIVIVSLVRSNEGRSIGFLKEQERVTVMLSRARFGMVLIGNSETLENCTDPNGRDLWKNVMKNFRDLGAVYEGVPVVCKRHPNSTKLLSSSGDFDAHAKDGGCNLNCDMVLPCGHICPKKCHPNVESTHNRVELCKVPVLRDCPNGHKNVIYTKCGNVRKLLSKCGVCVAEEECRKKVEEKKKEEQKNLRKKAEKNKEKLISNIAATEQVAAKKKELTDLQQQIVKVALEEDLKVEAERLEMQIKREKLSAPLEMEISALKKREAMRAEEAAINEAKAKELQDSLRALGRDPSLVPRNLTNLGVVSAPSADSKVEVYNSANFSTCVHVDQLVTVMRSGDKTSSNLREFIKLSLIDPIPDGREACHGWLQTHSVISAPRWFRSRDNKEQIPDKLLLRPLIGPAESRKSHVPVWAMGVAKDVAGGEFVKASTTLNEKKPSARCESIDERLLREYVSVELDGETATPGKIAKVLMAVKKSESESSFAADGVCDWVGHFALSMMLEKAGLFAASVIHSAAFLILAEEVMEEEKQKDSRSKRMPDEWVKVAKELISKHRDELSASISPVVLSTVGANENKSPAELMKLKPSEAAKEWAEYKSRDNVSSAVMDELVGMIGLEPVKKLFLSIIAEAKLNEARGIDMKKKRFGSIMMGNPGTGKTTVARIFAKLLVELNLLDNSLVIETSGAKLADGGASEVKEILKTMGKGGVLFVDEAYQLDPKNSQSGRGALNMLLDEMETKIGSMVVIFAGYQKDIEKLLEYNEGLPSRFPTEFKFPDYSDPELYHILKDLVAKTKYRCSEDKYFRIAARRVGLARSSRGFANARSVQISWSRMTTRQADRIIRHKIPPKLNGVVNPVVFELLRDDMLGPKANDALKESTAWKKLNEMIGLSRVKQSLLQIVDIQNGNAEREEREEPRLHVSLNRLFIGNPGTGKTTVAKLYAEVLRDIGLLSKGDVFMKSVSDFKGDVIGASESNTRRILQSAEGSVLAIDEAYGLHSGGSNKNDPFNEAIINTIVEIVQNSPGEDRCVLMMGYTYEMKDFIDNTNPGLKRRMNGDNPFVFEDYTDMQLSKILSLRLKELKISIDPKARIAALFVLARQRNLPNFGNAGALNNLLSTAQQLRQKRINEAKQNGSTTTAGFIESDFVDPALDSDLKGLTAAKMKEKLFGDLVGCESIKKLLDSIFSTLWLAKKTGDDSKRLAVPTCFLFVGPPGTGKTTVARRLGRMMHALDFLASPDVNSHSGNDFSTGYVGQAGNKTAKLVRDAIGKTLFIDEAYTLNPSNSHSFNNEIIDELVRQMTLEEVKGKTVIIMAGYEKEIEDLMKSNPGLKSRFTETVYFENFSSEASVALVKNLLNKQSMMLTKDAAEAIDKVMPDIVLCNNFANGRDLNTLVDNIIASHAAYVAKKAQWNEVLVSNADEGPANIQEEDAADEELRLVTYCSVKEAVDKLIMKLGKHPASDKKNKGDHNRNDKDGGDDISNNQSKRYPSSQIPPPIAASSSRSRPPPPPALATATTTATTTAAIMDVGTNDDDKDDSDDDDLPPIENYEFKGYEGITEDELNMLNDVAHELKYIGEDDNDPGRLNRLLMEASPDSQSVRIYIERVALRLEGETSKKEEKPRSYSRNCKKE
eukprot:GHVR01082672.1.p1 GENE.GHVR01082672.1~~GHVR01082672.1.p1  ORF type:complete len:2320 (+),score=323.74 GHVR01082672.1:1195-8154(+)